MTLLDLDNNIASIANELNFNKSTVAREIKKRSMIVHYSKPNKGVAKNVCIYRNDCNIKIKCKSKTCFKGFKNCRKCVECSINCVDFKEEICTRYKNVPYVCNACDTYKKCPLSKQIYNADHAHKHYTALLSASREGISIDEVTLEAVDDIITPLLKKGQSVRHICLNNMDKIMISEKTIYRYIGLKLLTADKFDLRRTVQRKLRKKAGTSLLVDKSCRVNRTFYDYIKHLEDNENPAVVQGDTVEGKKGGKVILTLYFCSCNLQLGFLRERNTAESVSIIFHELFVLLGAETYSKIFPVLLVDRGSEFSDPLKAELDPLTGEILSSLFYCDPQNSNQKAECERNHEFIRYVIPKGTSIDSRTQEDITLMMNHINSYSRKALNDKCPIELFEALYGKEVAKKLGIVRIPHDSITLTPELFKKTL